MELIANTTEFQLHKDTAVAIGKFDGVHVGHRALLAEVLKQKERGLAVCIFTFDPPPAVLFGFSDGKELSTKEEKRKLFEEMGVDYLIEFPLTRETADISGEDFIRVYLAQKMCARYIVAGEDLSFGRKGEGNAALLAALSKELGMETQLIAKVCVDGAEVSSTRIRGLVEEGDMPSVEKLLGAPYTVRGTVVRGNQIGRTLGFPTVNLILPEQKLLPPNGVYYAVVYYNGKKYRAISNVGCKPTVTDDKVMGLESFLYDFDEEIYDREIEVELLEFKRPERRFESLDALKKQLEDDIAMGGIYTKTQ